MNTWVVWLLVVLVLTSIAFIQVGLSISYQNKELGLELRLWRFHIDLMAERPAKKRQSTRNVSAKKPKPEKTKGEKQNLLQNPWVQALLEYWRDILFLIGRILKSPTLDVLQLQIFVGGSDAEACAMTYGKVCAVIGGVLPAVENTFGIRKRQINVLCCYDRSSIDIDAKASITVRIHEIFSLVFAGLGLGIKILIFVHKLKKAVQ